MGAQQASRTAVFVCQGRAVAHGRPGVGRFDDPTALALRRDGERTPVERARAGDPPKAWSHRLDVELFTRQAEAMVARTVAIDDVGLLKLAAELSVPTRRLRTSRVAVAISPSD